MTYSYDKQSFTIRKKHKWKYKSATEFFDYTTISDQVRTVSWSHFSNMVWFKR